MGEFQQMLCSVTLNLQEASCIAAVDFLENYTCAARDITQ